MSKQNVKNVTRLYHSDTWFLFGQLEACKGICVEVVQWIIHMGMMVPILRPSPFKDFHGYARCCSHIKSDRAWRTCVFCGHHYELTVASSHWFRTHPWQMGVPCPTLLAPWLTSTDWRRMRRSSWMSTPKTSSSTLITQRAMSLPLKPSSCIELWPRWGYHIVHFCMQSRKLVQTGQ